MNGPFGKQKGFVALFVVIIVGFVAIFFAVSSSSGVWAQAKSVTETRLAALTRFDALSCVSIARLKIVSEPDSTGGVGTHHLSTGECQIESLEYRSTEIILLTSAERSGLEISLETILNRTDLEITSVREI